MDPNYKTLPNDFADCMQSIVKLDVLERITKSLDEELADSQKAMNEIKDLFESIPSTQEIGQQAGNNCGGKQQDVSAFLDASPPEILLGDMDHQDSLEVNIDDVITSMKGYAEDLKRNFIVPTPQMRDPRPDIQSLNLDEYAHVLDQLCKRLAHIKLHNHDEIKKNEALEGKLDQLCHDVKNFSEMVELRSTVTEFNRNWSSTQQNNNALHYDNIINRLLSGINEVAYLLKTKN